MRKGQRIAVIGAGINGLVAANYLQRAGYAVTMLERKERVGGAASVTNVELSGKIYTYPDGASVLGMMQDFVFKETGLSDRLSTYLPTEPEILYFDAGNARKRHTYHDTSEQWIAQKRKRFLEDLRRVRKFLIEGYRAASVPTIERANERIGDKLTSLWISGSAYDLLKHYGLSEEQKIYHAMSVNESGPVSVHEPYSAFTIPLMASGSVFGGKWGFVKGGIWRITDTLASINRRLGVKIFTGASITCIDGHMVSYKTTKEMRISVDRIVFATDPLTAAKLANEKRLTKKVLSERLSGNSGKLVMFFKKGIAWEDGNDPSTARYVVLANTIKEMDKKIMCSSNFTPVYFEIYGEGAAMRKLGVRLPYDYLPVFFKSIGDAEIGRNLVNVRRESERLVLSHIKNREDFIGSVLITPKDLERRFYFPGGNIDHVELCEGQTFFQRNYSPNPAKSFYQFGDREFVFYCGAGSYPCGSVAGTPGYMCARQIMGLDGRA